MVILLDDRRRRLHRSDTRWSVTTWHLKGISPAVPKQPVEMHRFLFLLNDLPILLTQRAELYLSQYRIAANDQVHGAAVPAATIPPDPPRRSRATDSSSARFGYGRSAGGRPSPRRPPAIIPQGTSGGNFRETVINADGDPAVASSGMGRGISGKGIGLQFRAHSLAPHSLAQHFPAAHSLSSMDGRRNGLAQRRRAAEESLRVPASLREFPFPAGGRGTSTRFPGRSAVGV